MSNRPRRGHPRPNYANNYDSEDDRIEYPFDQQIDLFMETVQLFEQDTAELYLKRHSNVNDAIANYYDDQERDDNGDDAGDDDDAMAGVEEAAAAAAVGRDGDDADNGVVDAAPEPVAATVGKN